MTLPSKVSSLDGVDDSMGDSHVAGQSADPMGTMQSQLIPVPGQSDLLWRPGHGPFMNTITGPVFWYALANWHAYIVEFSCSRSSIVLAALQHVYPNVTYGAPSVTVLCRI